MAKAFRYGECDRCGGEVTEKTVQQICSHKGRVAVVVDDVPAGVCVQCGERYFRSDVAEHLEEITRRAQKIPNQISLPLAKYAA